MHNFTGTLYICLCAQKPVTALETEKTRMQIQRHGHRGILTMDPESKMETITTVRAAYVPPKGPGVRLRGMCLCFPQ